MNSLSNNLNINLHNNLNKNNNLLNGNIETNKENLLNLCFPENNTNLNINNNTIDNGHENCLEEEYLEDMFESDSDSEDNFIPYNNIENGLESINKFNENYKNLMNEDCSICLNNFNDNKEISKIKNCKHNFHSVCLNKWLDLNKIRCPYCKTIIY